MTWGLAAVAGMGVAVYLPDTLPDLTRSAVGAPARPTPGPAASPGTSSAARTRPPGATPSPGRDDSPGARLRAADKAVQYAQARGWRSGIAVLDLQNGELVVAGDAQGYFHTMSTVKLFIAAQLLVAGKIGPHDEGPALAMISASDDAAANGLYAAAGGDGLIPWVSTRYGITRLGTPPTRGAGQWGSSQVTPLGMVRFLKAAAEDPAVSAWLPGAMFKLTPVAADGTNQVFGLRAADPLAIVKQGWGGDGNPADVEGAPSVGYVDRGRYAVAIFTSKLPEESLRTAQDIVTAQAKILLPDGRMPRF